MQGTASPAAAPGRQEPSGIPLSAAQRTGLSPGQIVLIVVAAIVQFAIITPMAITVLVRAVGADLGGLSYLPEINDALDDGGGLLTQSVPGDWGRVPAPSGRISIAVDPGWTLIPGSADTGTTADGDELESIGWWQHESSDSLTVGVVVVYGAGAHVTTERQALWVYRAMVEWETDNTLSTASVATAEGFVGHEIQATGESPRQTHLTVLAISTGDSLVSIYAGSNDARDDTTRIARTIAQSITVEDGG